MVNYDEVVWEAQREQQQKITSRSEVLDHLKRAKLGFVSFYHHRGDLNVQAVKPWYLRTRTFRRRLDQFVRSIKPRLPYHIRLMINGVEL